MFLAPEIFLGCAPQKILDRHYKIWPSTDHLAKFHAGRPTHLGDFALKEIKNKTSGVKLKSAPQAIAFGRTNNKKNCNISIYVVVLQLYVNQCNKARVLCQLVAILSALR